MVTLPPQLIDWNKTNKNRNEKLLIMKKVLLLVIVAVMTTTGAVAKKKYLDNYAPEERSLNMMKITDEGKTSVLAPSRTDGPKKFAASLVGGSKQEKFYWNTMRTLATSPDGTEIAYIKRENKQDNIMIRRTSGSGAATQRTFRDIFDFSWGPDGKLYFSCKDMVGISMIDAHTGSLVRQLTNGESDRNPVVSRDGKLVFFTRLDRSGPAIWSYDTENGALTMCALGYNPCLIGNNKDKFICVRNNTSGNSEIWIVDYVRGQETILLSDKKISYTNPNISPDGQWIVCQGNAKSSITKKNNLDIYAIRLDGTGYIQLTYHPADDVCPVFSADGAYIYFISSRASKDDYYNVWRMNFSGYAF